MSVAVLGRPLAAALEQVVAVEDAVRADPVEQALDGRPVNACTRPGAASASAPNTLGAMYQPVRVRMFTASGRSQFMMVRSGAPTRIGR